MRVPTLGTGATEAGLRPRVFWDLVLHLARREVESTHRATALGWTWPLVRQMAQLGVLVFVFSSVVELGIKNYAVFVLSGLIAFAWFSAGIGGATVSLLANRHLLFQPKLPAAVVPLVAVAVPLLDFAVALPILLVLVQIEEGLRWTTILLPFVVLVQLVLMSGLAWLTAAASVFLRDIPNVVAVGVNLLFYVTPVFYGLRTVPDRFETVLRLNPMTTIVEAQRAVLLGSPTPPVLALVLVSLLAVVLAVVGYVVFRRVEDRFVDWL